MIDAIQTLATTAIATIVIGALAWMYVCADHIRKGGKR
jgi:hypothetical protein